ncbi:MAG: hypothetical protein WAZ75_02710 [Candidatus Absconditicoccaceae bacterium]
MKEIKTTMNLESGIWKINIFEIGNTYQLGAENGEKNIHCMVNKRDYLQDLLDRQMDKQAKEKYNFSCEGKELLTETEFQTMKKLLLENMDADLTQEKIQWGIVSDTKD